MENADNRKSICRIVSQYCVTGNICKFTRQYSSMQFSNSDSLCINNHLPGRWGYFDKVCIPNAKANARRHSDRALHFKTLVKLYHNEYLINKDLLDYFANNFMWKAYLHSHQYHNCGVQILVACLNCNKYLLQFKQATKIYTPQLWYWCNVQCKLFQGRKWNYPLVTLVVTTGTIISWNLIFMSQRLGYMTGYPDGRQWLPHSFRQEVHKGPSELGDLKIKHCGFHNVDRMNHQAWQADDKCLNK